MGCCYLLGGCFRVLCKQNSGAMYEVVRMFIQGEGPPIAGAQILQKLNSGAGGRSQGSDTKVRTEDVVQVFLLRTVIFALSGNPQTKKIAIKLEARFRVGNCDCGVINSEKKAAIKTMPLGITLPFGEPEDFDGMLVRILEVESPDAACVLVPIREALRRGRGVLDLVLTENCIGEIHVADDDGDVLKPEVVALRIHGNRASAGSDKLNELDRFVAKFHLY